MTESLKSGNGSAVRMGEPGETRKITRNIEWKLNLADLIMQVDELPEDALRMFVKMQYSKMHEGAAAEGFQQINIDEAINAYGGDVREALKRYLKGWFLLNIPLEGGSLGPVPPDAPPIVQRVWKNLEMLLLHPFDDEVRMAQEVQKRTDAFETATREYSIRLAGALKTFDKLASPKKEWATQLNEAYTKVESAAKDLEDLAKKYEAEKSGHENAEKRIETQEKQIAGIRGETARLLDNEKTRYAEAQKDIDGKKSLIKDLSAEVESTKTTNDDLGKKVEQLETEVKKERKDREIYQAQSIKIQKSYDDKEKELVQEREITKSERGKADATAAKANKLEKKLNNVNLRLAGWAISAAAFSFLAAGLIFYHPSQPVVQNESVPEKVINYVPSKDEMIVTFGKDTYKLSADTFSNIYKEIQRDEQKANRKFLPAEEKKYFDDKSDKTHYIKDKK